MLTLEQWKQRYAFSRENVHIFVLSGKRWSWSEHSYHHKAMLGRKYEIYRVDWEIYRKPFIRTSSYSECLQRSSTSFRSNLIHSRWSHTILATCMLCIAYTFVICSLILFHFIGFDFWSCVVVACDYEISM